VTEQDLGVLRECKSYSDFSFAMGILQINLKTVSPAVIEFWQFVYDTCENDDAIALIAKKKESLKSTNTGEGATEPAEEPESILLPLYNQLKEQEKLKELQEQQKQAQQATYLPNVFVIFRCKTKRMGGTLFLYLVSQLTFCIDLCDTESQRLGDLVKKVCGSGMKTTSPNQTEISIIEPKTISDAYGLWTYDVLCGHLKIVVCLTDREKPLPQFFYLDASTHIEWAVQFQNQRMFSPFHKTF
jgi:hypothetical protein